MQINLQKLLEQLPKDTTQAKLELGNLLGSQHKVYYRIRKPKAAISPNDLKILSEYFDCSIDELFEEEQEQQDVMERHRLSK